MTVESKRELGQYFTKDEVWLRPHIKEHIISLMEKYKLCVDPFAGDGHLLNIAKVFGYGDKDKSFLSPFNQGSAVIKP